MIYPCQPMGLVATAAVTPEFASVNTLFAAWRAGRPRRWKATDTPASMDWDTLITRALEPILSKVDDLRRCGVILATAKGNIAEIEAWMEDSRQGRNVCEWPELMSDSLGTLVRKFGLGGPCYCVSTACTSGLTALIEATELITSGVVTEAIVLAAETITGFTRDGFKSLKALTNTTCRPFDKNRDGLQLGSAAAACLIRPLSPNPGPQNTIVIAGWGMAADAVHRTAPDRAAGGLVRAIRNALTMAAISPDAVDAVVLHSTGTRYNDAMEAVAMRTLFPHRPALTGVKGLIGHTLGAAGLIETVLAARCLTSGIVPPMVGLEQSEYADLNLVINSGPARPLKYILKTASGFGGLNAAVVLSRTARE